MCTTINLPATIIVIDVTAINDKHAIIPGHQTLIKGLGGGGNGLGVEVGFGEKGGIVI